MRGFSLEVIPITASNTSISKYNGNILEELGPYVKMAVTRSHGCNISIGVLLHKTSSGDAIAIVYRTFIEHDLGTGVTHIRVV